mmetsp:Transcript_30655/g.78287  ORF Transcript_30655/g.78287 Transcript_30655/m.78287 type:complete len:246 (-) Transcript_30655:1049-1786(-)
MYAVCTPSGREAVLRRGRCWGVSGSSVGQLWTTAAGTAVLPRYLPMLGTAAGAAYALGSRTDMPAATASRGSSCSSRGRGLQHTHAPVGPVGASAGRTVEAISTRPATAASPHSSAATASTAVTRSLLLTLAAISAAAETGSTSCSVVPASASPSLQLLHMPLVLVHWLHSVLPSARLSRAAASAVAKVFAASASTASQASCCASADMAATRSVERSQGDSGAPSSASSTTPLRAAAASRQASVE